MAGLSAAATWELGSAVTKKVVGGLRLMPDTKKDGENRWRVQSG
jgi:hypothetical protein